MGMSNIQTQQHRAALITLPDTPPELVSPSSSTYSSLPSEGHSTWRSRSNGPLSPPMSSYDRPQPSITDDMSRKSHEEAYVRKDAMRQPPSSSTASGGVLRPQLPSLSSLFPPGQRTLPSPLSERPSYSATSPLDPPPPRSAGGYLERSGSSASYFPPAGAAHPQQVRTGYEPPKLFERGVPPPPPTHSRTATFHGRLSPGLREPSLSSHRADSSNRWSLNLDVARGNEYSFGGRDHHPGRYQPQQVVGQKHDHEGYLSNSSSNSTYRSDPQAASQQQQQHHHYHHQQQQQQQQHPSAYTHQPPPIAGGGSGGGSGGSGETIPTKDGLGPKIWTGTHFLPRFVHAAELPGEGTCYFYDDGSHCKTVIDGEVVNAHWGVTKAGKPRKRLAIACVTCREKKIKCDPDYPRCVQCEKFGRVCKFKNAPRGGGHHNTSPSSPPGEREEESPQRRRALFEYPRRRHSASISPRTTEAPLALAAPPKRVSYEPAYQPAGSGDRRDNGPAPPPSSWQQRPAGQLPLPRLSDDIFRQQQRRRNDPYAADTRHQQEMPRRPDARV